VLDSDLRLDLTIPERDDLRLYQIHEFAELAGVTVKALYHYDRLGLLKARRTETGYRMYAVSDLELLEQIVALKFLGLPLMQIKSVLERPASELPDALRTQRKALEEKRALLDLAIRSIQAAEESMKPNVPADPTILKKIIEAIDMQDGVEVMKKYYGTEESWQRHRRYYEEGPSAEWQAFYREAGQLLGEDPASDRAQALADRWLQLSVRAYSGEAEAQTDSPKAWMDREHWPPAMKQRMAEFRMEETMQFIRQAAEASRKRYFSPEAWDKYVALRKLAAESFPFAWQARVDLFRDIEAALEQQSESETARALVERWMAQVDETTGGDPEVQAGLLRTWAGRRNWPATLRWQMEGVYGMTAERFDRAADFLERALGAAGCNIALY
jgi:DNA-binding transcriptional MerR regulator